jgi:bifunctional non-homologous end joining protein LigD
MKAATRDVRIGKNIVTVSNPEKVLFPDDGITKADLVAYYQRIAEFMVPHIKGRPLNMQRYPDGIKGQEFFQQSAPDNLPDWINRVTVPKSGGTTTHMVCDNAAGLVYLANLACITPHTWLSRADRLNTPDQIIFDLDPPGEEFEPAREGALYLRDLLEQLGLTSYLKTTGSHGLHVVVPIGHEADFEWVRTLAADIAGVMVSREPEKYTVEQRKEKRLRRLFVDTLRNAYAHTAVAAYAVRARPKAPVAAPLKWDELNDKALTAQSYTISNMFARLEKSGDPWKGMERQAQPLILVRRKLNKLVA